MILSGSEIKARLGGDIRIDPFVEDQLNPNSYNLRLHDELLVYEEIVLDMKRANRYRRITIPPEGLMLEPNQMYLGRTVEYTEPAVRGDTSGKVMKPARLKGTGFEIPVPAFVNTGDVIEIDTRTDEFKKRV